MWGKLSSGDGEREGGRGRRGGRRRKRMCVYNSYLYNLYYLENNFTYPRPQDLHSNSMQHRLEMRKLSLESLNDTILYSSRVAGTMYCAWPIFTDVLKRHFCFYNNASISEMSEDCPRTSGDQALALTYLSRFIVPWSCVASAPDTQTLLSSLWTPSWFPDLRTCYPSGLFY